MNVLVLTTMTPFVHGRAEELTSQLVRQMKLHGVNAEAMRLPFKAHPPERLLDEMFIFKSLKLHNVDRVVSLAFPAELVPFESRTCWQMSEYQQAHDFCQKLEAEAGQGSRAETIRDALIRNETRSFQSAKHLFAGSAAIQTQIQRYHGLSSDLLLPPLLDPERFEAIGDDGYILASGGVDAAEQLFPLIDAMRLVSPNAKLVIAGQPENAVEAEKLRKRVHEANVEGRVTIDPQRSREALAELVGRARAVISIGDEANPAKCLFMEAFQASKPVLATTDWLRNIVIDGEAGIVRALTPEALADGMETLLESPNRAMSMGVAGGERWRSLKVDWSTTVERLLA